MTTYNTGNPLGSTDPRDLYDNAENFDEALHTESAGWTDRLGKRRMSWEGVQDRVNDLIVAGGRIFESEEAGRAEVSDGDYYLVIGSTSDSAIDVWRRVNSYLSDFITSKPSAEVVRRLSSILAEHEGQPLLEFVLETGEWLGEYNGDGWELGRATVEDLTTDEHHIGDSTLKSTPGGVPFQITTEDDDVIAEVDGEGCLGVFGLSTPDGSRITSDDSSDVLTITTEDGDDIAAVDGSGTLSVVALNVGGYPVYGSPEEEGEAFEYTAPYVPQESIDLINSLDVTDADGNLPSTPQVAPKLSVDYSKYGFRYAHLASSIVWVGDRLWMAAFGQNLRPGDNGEKRGSFIFLRYCDDPFTPGAEWREVLYFVPDTDAIDKANLKSPRLGLMPDGRMLVQGMGRYNETEETWGFIIDNPGALRGKFTVGRIFWISKGSPSRRCIFGNRFLVAYDRNDDLSKIKELQFPGVDKIKAVDFVTIPQPDPISDKQTSESSFSVISGGRFLYLQRALYGLGQSISDPGGESWSAPIEEWTEYPAPASRASQATSPSGRLVRAWNNSSTSRDNLTLAISEDEGKSFPTTLLLQTAGGIKRETSYPCIDFKKKGGDVIITVSYDYGRELSEEGETQIALISENKVMSGNATQKDITYITAAKASGGL